MATLRSREGWPLDSRDRDQVVVAGFVERAKAGRDLWWNPCGFKPELLAAVRGDEQLAWAVFASCEAHPLRWLSEAHPVLDGATPESCLSDDDGRRLRKEVAQLKVEGEILAKRRPGSPGRPSRPSLRVVGAVRAPTIRGSRLRHRPTAPASGS